jgi:hypothetical protein
MKTTLLHRFYAGLLLSLAATAQTSAQNIVINGNFEQPDVGFFGEYGSGSTEIIGWTVTGSGVQIFDGGGDVLPDDPLEGGGGQKLQLNVSGGSSGDQGGLSQTITLELGTIYTVTFDSRARANDTTGGGTVTFSDGGLVPQQFSFLGTQDWQRFTFTTTPATGTSGTISFWASILRAATTTGRSSTTSL